MVESASWPPGEASETKSFMVSERLSLVLTFDVVDSSASDRERRCVVTQKKYGLRQKMSITLRISDKTLRPR